ncbi:MAG: helix-turn-helix transcriptional regulator [Lachnospiraceae bacterium]|nr:helix-turn-helix transcriptional regulator [Lachnospiraceae bacterium]
MEIYGIGQRIREERVRQKFSQEELSYGICAVSTLSRLENGVQKPGLKVQEALLERLGCSTENLVFFANEDEGRKHFLEVDMGFRLMNYEFDSDLQKELEEYEKLIQVRGVGSNLEQQYYLMVKAMYELHTKKQTPEQVYAMLKKALLLTMPDFKAKKLYGIRLMTLTEINILNDMAVTLYEMKSMGLAMKYIFFLTDYVEKGNFSRDVLVKRYPMLLVNLAKLEIKLEDFEQVFYNCQKGIAFCKECGRMVPLAELYYYKAVACVRLGRRKTAMESYEHAICLLKIRDKNEFAKQIQKEYQSVLTHLRCTSAGQLHQPEAHHNPRKPEAEQKTKSDQLV